MCYAVAFLFSLYVFYRLYRHFFPTPDIDTKGKYVLISGCDSGFGNALAIELDRKGFNVLAGVLVHDNIKVLKEKLSSNATVFSLDITRQDDIDAAYELVKTKTNVLHALVNNAGIGFAGYVDWMPLELMHKIMNVNFFGHVAMTKRFIPLLITKQDSRVVNITSVMGVVTPPGLSAYCASKFAFESFSDCLRREMAPWNLRVCIIEPGVLRTQIITGHDLILRDLWNDLSEDVRKRWGDDFFNCLIKDQITRNPFIKYAEDPMKVVHALEHAIMNTKPCIRYNPDWYSKLFFYPISMLPAWLFDFIVLKCFSSSILPAGVQHQTSD